MKQKNIKNSSQRWLRKTLLIGVMILVGVFLFGGLNLVSAFGVTGTPLENFIINNSQANGSVHYAPQNNSRMRLDSDADGVREFVHFYDSEVNDWSSDNVYSFWMNLSYVPNTDDYYWGKTIPLPSIGGSPFDRYFGLDLLEDRKTLYFFSRQSPQTIPFIESYNEFNVTWTSPTQINDSQWHNIIAYKARNGNMSLIFDGVVVNSTLAPTQNDSTRHTFERTWITNIYTPHNYIMDIDEVRRYDCAQYGCSGIPSQVDLAREIYNSGRLVPNSSINSSSLTHWITFNENISRVGQWLYYFNRATVLKLELLMMEQ
jgi:hypothetical protein